MRLAIIFTTVFMANILMGQAVPFENQIGESTSPETNRSYMNDAQKEVLAQAFEAEVQISVVDTLESPTTDASKTVTKKPLLPDFDTLIFRILQQ